MSKSPETPKPRRNLKSRLAIGAISAVGALGIGGSATAAAKPRALHTPRHAQSTAVLQRRAESRINHRRPIEVYNGTLTLRERQQNPQTHRWRTVMANIDHPLVVFRGNPKAETPRDPVWSGDYAFGSVVDKLGHAVVDLVNYDPNTMTLTPDTKPPYITDGILEGGKGSLEFNQLTDPEGHGNPILLDPDGHPELVAYEYTPKK